MTNSTTPECRADQIGGYHTESCAHMNWTENQAIVLTDAEAARSENEAPGGIYGPPMEATPTTVAQAISRVVDEYQEFHHADGETGLLLDEDNDEGLRINEVGAQLHHLLGGNVEFEVKTSDGRTFTVRVSENA
jgi:hypothetical protein